MSIMGNQSLSQRTEIGNRQDELYKVTMLSEKVRAIGSVLLPGDPEKHKDKDALNMDISRHKRNRRRTRRTPDRVRRFLEAHNDDNIRKLREDRIWSRRRRDKAIREERDRANYLRWKMGKREKP